MMIHPVQPVLEPPVETPSMICLDDDDAVPPPNVQPNIPQAPPNVPQYPDDANYFMPSDQDEEVVKAWGQFPQWSRYCTSKKVY